MANVSADSYFVEESSEGPVYFDFVYEAKPVPKRNNFIKDQVVLLYPADKAHTVKKLTKKYGLVTESSAVLSSVNTGMVVANTKGQNPLDLSETINKKEKTVEAATNNIFLSLIHI